MNHECSLEADECSCLVPEMPVKTLRLRMRSKDMGLEIFNESVVRDL